MLCEIKKSAEKISAVMDQNLISADVLVGNVSNICVRDINCNYLSLHQPSHELPDGNL